MTGARTCSVTLVFCLCCSGYAAEVAGDKRMTTIRDWQVENPLSAGITRGMTLGLFPGAEYGEGGQIASKHDPFGMPVAVYEQVASHGKAPYQIGKGLGLGLWAFTLGGVFFRLLHTLKVDDLEKRNAS